MCLCVYDLYVYVHGAIKGDLLLLAVGARWCCLSAILGEVPRLLLDQSRLRSPRSLRERKERGRKRKRREREVRKRKAGRDGRRERASERG